MKILKAGGLTSTSSCFIFSFPGSGTFGIQSDPSKPDHKAVLVNMSAKVGSITDNGNTTTYTVIFILVSCFTVYYCKTANISMQEIFVNFANIERFAKFSCT